MSNKQDSIRALSEREKAREKLPVFFGSYDNYYHGFREVLNNSCDELLNHFEQGIINITLHDDNRTITIEDTGRGIPITSYDNAKLLFETLFASGKYDVTEKTNSGVNGVGNTILQYSSEYFQCISKVNGKTYQITYKDGGDLAQELCCLGNTDEHGTKITFKLDDTCYTETIFNPKELELIIRRVSMISENITFNFTYEGNTKIFNHTLEEYFNKYSNDIIGESYTFSKSEYERNVEVERKGVKEEVTETAEIQIVFGTCSGEEPLQETMLNGNYLKENGTLYDGVLEGFKLFINKHCKEKGLYKSKEKGITNQDIESAISFVCRLFNNLVEFESQVKFSTKKEYYKQVVKDYIQTQLEIYKAENIKEFNRLVEQVLICKRANETNMKARQDLKKKLTDKVDNINNRVDGFVDCEVDKGGELFLSEGLSALGSIVLARNSEFQACYPLRGKLLNCLKANIFSIFKNDEIKDIIRLLGTGIEISNKYTKDFPKFDLNNMKFSKIICASDADSDGKQINVLILTALYKLVPSIIKEGYVYIAQPPLFQIKVTDDEVYYALSIKEKDDILNTLDNKKYEIHRLKGLGETSKEVMYDTVCNPKTRALQQVTVSDIEQMAKSFEVWMDKEIDGRKEIIETNLYKYLIEPPIHDIISEKDITDIVEDNMMEYASEVIFDRAIVSVESGLKPSQQKILWGMKANNRTKLTKSMNIVGDLTAYHEHGSVYPTIVNMCQNDRHSLPLVFGEGNFGQHTSKLLAYASDRYTNVKLTDLALDGLREVDKHYVEMIPTYDGKHTMPLYLPNKYPLILTQSSMGMAVGMASKMPSFNLNEVCGATINYLINGEKSLLIPDFATKGIIENNATAINNINYNGKGSIKLRGNYILKDNSIIITEIPYGVFREDIIDKVIEGIKNGKFKECISIKDLTDLKGMKIKIECKKNANLEDVIAKLYKLTPFETAFYCNMNVLYKGMPKVCGVWEIIDKWIEFRKECIINGMNYEISELKKELHILHGLEKILLNIDETVETIRFNENPILGIMMKFGLDETQAKYVVNTKLLNINELHIKNKIKDIRSLEEDLKQLKINIQDNDFITNKVVEDLEYINNKFKSPRKTVILDGFDKTSEELLIEDYNCQIQISNDGYFKKTKLTSLKSSTNKLKDGDKVMTTLECTNKDELLIFCEDLNCYKFKLSDIEETKLSNLGQYMFNETKSKVLGMSVINPEYKYVIIVYENGNIAKISLDSYKTNQNRKVLSKSLNSPNVFGIYTIKNDLELNISVSDDRIKKIDTKELTLNKSRSSNGKKIITWKNVKIKSVEI